MRPCRVAVWSCALVMMGGAAGPAQAAWCNVFQVTCFRCRSRPPAVANYAPAPCCPQPTCTTQYVQRCYYQPVTCYQTRTYYEPVTTYRTSYYWEPVTAYRYSCYYDPCTCSYQNVATQMTSYRLRSQCCPVQSWVERCCQVPVTTVRQSCYWEPVTTCCAPPPCPSPCATPAPAVSEQVSPSYQTPPPPRVSEQSTPATGTNGTYNYDRYYYSPSNPMPKAQDSSYRQVPPQGPSRPAAPPPSVKLDKIVALPPDDGNVGGRVVRDDQTPRAGAKLMFVSASRQGTQETITADAAGQFRVTLASGGWLVYVHNAEGQPAFHCKIEVKDHETRQLTLVSR